MDKISVIADMMKISLEFDNALTNGKFCELQKYSDKFNEKISVFTKEQLTQFDKEILDLFDKLGQINTYAVSYTAKQCNQSHKDGLNTLLLFYSDKCRASMNFASEWKRLKTSLRGRVNLIAVNCKDKDHKDICNFFKIYEYPTIKYITPTKIHDYYGAMLFNEIIDTFLLV